MTTLHLRRSLTHGGARLPVRVRTQTGALFSALAAIVVAFFATAPVSAQDALPAPPVRVEPETVKLGSLAPKETGAIAVKLINTSDKTLRFERAMGSCSCIKGTVTPEPIKPGEAATVNLTMQAIINDGVQHKQLYVFAEGYKRPVTINVEANVVDPNPIEGKIKIEPSKLDAGYISPGAEADHMVMLRNNSDQPIQFARVSTTCTCVTGELLDDLVAPGEAARLKVTVHAKDFPGPINQKLTVWFVGARHPLQIPVTAMVTLPVEADPFFINLATPAAGDPKGKIPTTGVIKLTALDDRPFRVLSAGGSSPVLDPGDDDAPATTHVVHWDFTDVPGDALKPWWIIETDHPDAPIIDLRVIHPALIRKMMASQGPWTIAPDRIIVPNIVPGSSMERTIRLVRLKSDAVKSISIESPLLSVEILDQTKSPTGLELKVRITASPDAKGMIRSTLSINADGSEESAYLFARILRAS